MTGLRDDLLAEGFREERDGTLSYEAVVAERRTLLSRQRLTYRARLRVDDEARTVRCFELLKETSRGLVGGLTLTAEATRLAGKERTGTIEQRSRYLGRRYDFRVDYAAVRSAVERAAQARGYGFELVLRERSLRA
jgi:hypothetical protein